MRTIILCVSLIVSLFSANLAWAQNLPPSTSLTVDVLPSYSYKADDGTTVVLGEVQNNNNFPIAGVKIGVSFLDANDNTIEYKAGTTLLQVVPAGGKAPFSISSTKVDPSITQVSTKMAGFISSSTKDQVLDISTGLLQISEKLILSGTIKNNGALKSTNTKIYLISYDVFQRVVAIGTGTTSDISTGEVSKFNMTSDSNGRAKSFTIVAESDNYQSKLTDITQVQFSLPVMIGSTQVTDPQGNKYSSIPVGAPVKITSNLKYIANQSPQPYVYYVQVKQFSGQVEFIGKYEGAFLGIDNQTASVTWTPKTNGSYYIETFVWDSSTVPLSSAGTRINVVLVQS